MASCEKCHKKDIPFTEMRTAEEDGEKLLVGPCCANPELPPALGYHFEVSSKNGIVANVEYGGLRLEYKRSPTQLSRQQEKQVEASAEVH